MKSIIIFVAVVMAVTALSTVGAFGGEEERPCWLLGEGIYEQFRKDLKEHLAEQYPDNYSIQRKLFQYHDLGFKQVAIKKIDDTKERILRRLVDNYYPNFALIKKMYEKQLEDYKALQQE